MRLARSRHNEDVPPTITLLTDFGLHDAYAGVLHGVIRRLAPDACVIDLCHQVPAQDVEAGAFLLMTAFSYFPPGTIHVAVVDPGVGTARRIVAVRAGDFTFVGPDNGVLRWAIERAGPIERMVSVEAAAYRLPRVSQTFHGRDIMAPAAAYLAQGVPLEALGPPVEALAGRPFPQPERRAGAVRGEVLYIDHFGNAITNLPPEPGAVEVAGHRLVQRRAYGEVAPGEALALAGSSGFLEVAVRNGSAAQRLGLHRGLPATLWLEERSRP